MIVNTFNIRGEPIVGSPSDAYRRFMYGWTRWSSRTPSASKKQPEMAGADDYKAQFKLD